MSLAFSGIVFFTLSWTSLTLSTSFSKSPLGKEKFAGLLGVLVSGLFV
jgi:hypothetical protein